MFKVMDDTWMLFVSVPFGAGLVASKDVGDCQRFGDDVDGAGGRKLDGSGRLVKDGAADDIDDKDDMDEVA